MSNKLVSIFLTINQVPRSINQNNTLQATCYIRKVSLWLGHSSIQSTEIYLRADQSDKLDALAKVIPPSLSPELLT